MIEPVGSAARTWGTTAAGFAVVALTYLVAVRTTTGRRLDIAAQRAAVHHGGHVKHALFVALNVSPQMVTALAVLLFVVGLVARRPLASVTTLLLVGVAEVTTEVVKAFLVRPGGINTLPSGHLTVITGLVVSLVVLVPSPWRRFAVVLGLATVIVAGVGTWVIDWHRPSDSIAALGVVLAWWGVRQAVAARFPQRPRAYRGTAGNCEVG